MIVQPITGVMYMICSKVFGDDQPKQAMQIIILKFQAPSPHARLPPPPRAPSLAGATA